MSNLIVTASAGPCGCCNYTPCYLTIPNTLVGVAGSTFSSNTPYANQSTAAAALGFANIVTGTQGQMSCTSYGVLNAITSPQQVLDLAGWIDAGGGLAWESDWQFRDSGVGSIGYIEDISFLLDVGSLDFSFTSGYTHFGTNYPTVNQVVITIYDSTGSVFSTFTLTSTNRATVTNTITITSAGQYLIKAAYSLSTSATFTAAEWYSNLHMSRLAAMQACIIRAAYTDSGITKYQAC